MTTQQHHVRFLFDPACPWAWRTSLWIREVAKVRPVEIEWDLLSLAYVNRDTMDDAGRVRAERRQPALRVLAKAKQVAGNEGIDRLYLALGHAVHEHKERLENQATLEAALHRAELPAKLLTEAQNDARIDDAIVQASARATADGAFGVPTLYFDGSNAPYFGPVIKTVPSGEEAGQLWDHVIGLAQYPYFYELKRSR